MISFSLCVEVQLCQRSYLYYIFSSLGRVTCDWDHVFPRPTYHLDV